ncbi:tRNA N6-adenosine threonylcarbamoyltransferase, mitochondrial [Lepeophtheirus salmonis]|nr:probable tRNA N6-adenosine threonylcarbamoyltransferase, mitochondrial [Lepeophtheirus salmonis]
MARTVMLCPRGYYWSFLSKRAYILGIESSCDDTGAALLDSNGKVLGESLRIQSSSRFGGVIPSIAMGRHARALPQVVDTAMGSTSFSSLRAIAISNQPGLKGSLAMGIDYAKYLSIKYDVPLIPIHHMEAHALTPRFIYPDLTFPYLFLLISGGHCILGVVSQLDDFKILGYSPDSPGEALDKVARALKLNVLDSSLKDVSGGKCIEMVALNGNPKAYEFPIPLMHKRSCNFSFSGLKSKSIEMASGLSQRDQVSDFCASFQYAIGRHICMRLQRALEYVDLVQLMTDRKLVVSGGVACNKTLRSYIDKIASTYGYDTYYPPPQYCTDNGLMIAWNGIEKMRAGWEMVQPKNALSIQPLPRGKFGTNISDSVIEKNISCKWIKIIS